MPGAPGSPKAAIAAGDVGLVQGLLVVAQQLKKYAADGLQTNGGETATHAEAAWVFFFLVFFSPGESSSARFSNKKCTHLSF